LKTARILTYGYDAQVVRLKVTSTNRLLDHATDLLNDLSGDRSMEHASKRPLIFVAHSLGGLVVKKALLLLRNNSKEHLRQIFDYTKAIAFMGTPHSGSSWRIGPRSPPQCWGSSSPRIRRFCRSCRQMISSSNLSRSSSFILFVGLTISAWISPVSSSSTPIPLWEVLSLRTQPHFPGTIVLASRLTTGIWLDSYPLKIKDTRDCISSCGDGSPRSSYLNSSKRTRMNKPSYALHRVSALQSTSILRH